MDDLINDMKAKGLVSFAHYNRAQAMLNSVRLLGFATALIQVDRDWLGYRLWEVRN